MCVFHTWLQKNSDPGRQVLQETAVSTEDDDTDDDVDQRGR